MNRYEKEKIKRFNEYTLEDYHSSLIIEDIVKVNLVEKTDGSFTQIGIRPLINEDIFINPSFSEYLPGAGRMVAVGEIDFLIKNILDKKEIEKIEFKEDIKEFPKYVFDFNNPMILLSTKFYVEIFTKLMNRIDYEEKHPRLDRRYKIISVPERVIGNRIIIIPKYSVLWKKKLFYNEFTDKKEKLSVEIGTPKPEGKVDVTIKSLNKIEYIDKKEIKILEIVEESFDDGKTKY
ncbi:hypothetical protein KAT24_02490 [Candidatus Pacearchaeota archaeon]|nr:hypothetical protein [Candidatus Pacearchaeota archaeon]